MAISKITGLELPQKSEALSESYVKCTGVGMAPLPGTDADGIKGRCPECPGLIELREATDADGNPYAVLVAHLAGGKNPPVSAGTKGVRTSHPSRLHGQAVSFRGNTPCDVGDVPPIITGPDMDGSMPVPKMHKGREVPTNGTNAGGLGRARIYMNASTNLVGPQVPGLRGERDPRITQGEFAKLSRKQRQRYTKKINDMARAARAENKRRKEFDAQHGNIAVEAATASRRFTDEPSRPSGEIPVGTRVSVAWDSSKGGTFVDTIGRRAGERSPLDGIRQDGKPCHLKYKSEPIFGRTVRTSR